MASDLEDFFEGYFKELTGRTPYVWQRKLYAQMAGGAVDWPEVLDLPTGAGKTSVLHIWLLALAWSVRCGRFDVPRRLAWIVNRRVVVDQVTSDVESLVSTELGEDGQPQGLARCPEVRNLLASLSMSEIPLAVSTLRGQYADKGNWSRDPSTPAVVVGTVDMIGSRLLFRGYRSGAYHRPIHAGLLGVDSLIVNDEAHLSPAFVRLLDEVRTKRPASEISGKTFRILLLSATASSLPDLRRFDHDPHEDVAACPAFDRVFRAPKTLTLQEVDDPKSFQSVFWSTATDEPPPRTIVFVEQPEKAAQFAERLGKERLRCALLTGTMRGLERDDLMSNPVFQRFLDRDPGVEPVWLVSTSAGEVGVNLSCERMVTDLCEADHLLQRFGRLNRFGGPEGGEAFVVYRPPKEDSLTASLEYLKSLDGNISCSHVWDRRPPPDACSETPALARLESRHIDIWSQTTFKDRFVPRVASWLHGKQENVPETEVAWRADVSLLTEWEVGEDDIQNVLEYYPVLVRERLHEPSSRVAKKLTEIADRMGPAETRRTKLIVVQMDGSPKVHTLEIVLDRLARNEAFLDNVLLLLPDHLGSLHLGMFRGAESSANEEGKDVADHVPAGGTERERCRFVADGEGTLRRLVGPQGVSEGAAAVPASTTRNDLADFAEQHRYRPAVVVRHPEDENKAVVYFGALSQFARSNPGNIYLDDHQKSVSETARLLAERLGLSAFEKTFADCGRMHDSGKGREVWQRAMGRDKEMRLLAKTKAAANPGLLNGYRHEFGSLLDVLADAAHRDNDLLLHLVASHHAGARPYFEQKQYDRLDLAGSARECAEAVRRYARLQTRYGAWGLAYLEAVFKCADGLVSAREGEPTSA